MNNADTTLPPISRPPDQPCSCNGFHHNLLADRTHLVARAYVRIRNTPSY